MFYFSVITLAFLLVSDKLYAYSTEAHREIVVQASKTWSQIPTEIKERLKRNKINRECWVDFNIGVDNIFTGSAEEDHENNFLICFFPASENILTNDGLNGLLEHFWNPDFPFLTPSGNAQRGYDCDNEPGFYNLGLPDILPPAIFVCGEHFDSAYQLAQHYWDEKVIPLYLNLREDEAYWWLGRVAHLLADQTVPTHVHLTPHDPLVGQKDLYEEFVSERIVRAYSGDQFLDTRFNSECISNWKDVHPNAPQLFKLFFCTAQMTQYWASKSLKRDDFVSVGNNIYVGLDGDPRRFNPSLWEGVADPISDPNELKGKKKDVDQKLTYMTAVQLKVAYLATAELYRLFWSTVRSACFDTLDNDGDGKTDFPDDLGCTSQFDPNEAGNGSPQINNFSANPTSVFFSIGPCAVPSERQSVISVSASDPDGDALEYFWHASAGLLSGTSGSGNKTWTAPSGAGNAVITVTVTDPSGATASRSVTIIYASEGCISEQ